MRPRKASGSNWGRLGVSLEALALSEVLLGGSWGAWVVHLEPRQSIFERCVVILMDFVKIAKRIIKQCFFIVFRVLRGL